MKEHYARMTDAEGTVQKSDVLPCSLKPSCTKVFSKQGKNAYYSFMTNCSRCPNFKKLIFFLKVQGR